MSVMLERLRDRAVGLPQRALGGARHLGERPRESLDEEAVCLLSERERARLAARAHHAACGESDHLTGFSPSAGGVICASCEAGSFPLSAEGHAFLVGALAQPLAEAPTAADRALGQADRAIAETLEHHAHVRLPRVAA